jgi:23S rRNA (uridine2552-2'-O)-methyltransferase
MTICVMHWRKNQSDDLFYQLAKKEGYRSRAIFKLIEIDDKYKLIKLNMNILDLGASPGGWSQYVVKKLKNTGKIVAIDLLPMDPIPSVDFILGDIADIMMDKRIEELFRGEKMSLVISDIAPNITGVRDVDTLKSINLCEIALDIAMARLNSNGSLVLKLFQGVGFEDFLSLVRSKFKKVNIFKPKSSRPDSREVYLIASYLNMIN